MPEMKPKQSERLAILAPCGRTFFFEMTLHCLPWCRKIDASRLMKLCHQQSAFFDSTCLDVLPDECIRLVTLRRCSVISGLSCRRR